MCSKQCYVNAGPESRIFPEGLTNKTRFALVSRLVRRIYGNHTPRDGSSRYPDSERRILSATLARRTDPPGILAFKTDPPGILAR